MNIVEMGWAWDVVNCCVKIACQTSDGAETITRLFGDGIGRHYALRDTAWFDFIKLGLLFHWKPQGALLKDEKGDLYRYLKDGMNIEDSYDPLKLAEFKMVLGSDAAAWAGCPGISSGWRRAIAG